MRGCLKACMTASRTRRWEPGGKRSQTTKFGMRLPIFERWPPKEPGAWAADSDEIDALSDHVGAVDPDDWDRRMVYRAGRDDAGTDGRMDIVLAPAEAARSAGIEMIADVNPGLMAKLPLKQMGTSIHQDMDALADAIARKET